MLSPKDIQVFDVFPEGRRAIFGVLGDPDIPVKGVVLKEGSLALFYSDRLPGDGINKQIKKILIRPSASLSPGRLQSFYESIVEDRADLISVDLPHGMVKAAVPSWILQNNAFGVTANDIVFAQRGLDGKDRNAVIRIPSWMQQEVDQVITLGDLQAAVVAYKKGKKSPVAEKPATSPSRPAGQLIARVYPDGKIERHLH